MEEATEVRPRRRRGPTAYQQWKEGEGIPEHTGSYVDDMNTVAVGPWARFGQRGAFISLGDQARGDGYVLEIAPGGQTEVQHHLFELSLYVLHGRGATTFWQHGSDRKQTVEWQGGSVFAPPLNCYYQHFNLDGQQPARLFGLGNLPQLMNVLRSPEFIFNVPYAFLDRYNGEDEYFAGTGQHLGWRQWRTNFIPDIRAFKLDEYKERGAGGTNMHFSLANNALSGHVSEFPPATYKKGHRHGHGPHLIIVGGEGYSLFWYPGQPRRKVPWRDGAILVPQTMEFHQHFNTGGTLARYLVFGMGGAEVREDAGDRPLTGSTISIREGGDQIDYEDEDPAIYDEFVEECRRHGAEAQLPRPAYWADRALPV
ncbi:MAG: hypothetical protein QOF51_1687 [Chloroflexota bacterium]|jgi:hypothetical protein|nr:hypothetical protein [Chloroflexota bacterium]